MKCTYSFPADSVLRLPAPLVFRRGAREYRFQTEAGFISQLDVTVFNYPRELFPKQKPCANTWEYPIDKVYESLLPDIRVLEGALSIRGIRKINTQEYSVTWTVETAGEYGEFSTLTVMHKLTDPKIIQARDADCSDLVRNVISLDEIRHLEIPLTFHKHGQEAIRNHLFIEAIYNFYFFIESLFGNGKFKTSAIIAELLNATDLLDAIGAGIKTPHSELSRDPVFSQNFKKDYASKTIPEIVTQLVELRGFLHHHTLKRSDIWNPGDQTDYASDAYFWSEVCQQAAMTQIHRQTFSAEKTAELIATIAHLGNKVLMWHQDKNSSPSIKPPM